MRRLLMLLLLAVFTWTGSGCTDSGESTKGNPELTVALYPYVPRLEQFKEVIESAWKEIHPELTITWAEEWGRGYSQDSAPRLDV